MKAFTCTYVCEGVKGMSSKCIKSSGTVIHAYSICLERLAKKGKTIHSL